MERSFWIKNWREGRIGFHQESINPALTAHWPQVPVGSTVLVPLSGKSLDMLWLEQQGLNVIGIELAEQAVADFCRENDLKYTIDRSGRFSRYRLQNRDIELVVADYFEYAQDCPDAPFDALYDRAALVALPENQRSEYVELTLALMADSASGMVITLAYDQSLMKGPPFSVPDQEVQQHWKDRLKPVWQRDVLDELGKAQAAGIPSVIETTWVF